MGVYLVKSPNWMRSPRRGWRRVRNKTRESGSRIRSLSTHSTDVVKVLSVGVWYCISFSAFSSKSHPEGLHLRWSFEEDHRVTTFKDLVKECSYSNENLISPGRTSTPFQSEGISCTRCTFFSLKILFWSQPSLPSLLQTCPLVTTCNLYLEIKITSGLSPVTPFVRDDK